MADFVQLTIACTLKIHVICLGEARKTPTSSGCRRSFCNKLGSIKAENITKISQKLILLLTI